MSRNIRWGAALAILSLAVWWAKGYVSDVRYSQASYDVEEVSGPGFVAIIPKGWTRPDYADARESRTGFSTSSTVQDESSPYFVYGALHIRDGGSSKDVDSIIADLRKEDRHDRITKAKFGALDALTWTSLVPGIHVAGKSRTIVYTGSNGHTYTAHFPLVPSGRHRMRQEFVFGRILSSLKFK